MENNYYQIYLESNIKLAESLTIKSADTATAINTYQDQTYADAVYDSLDMTTWKYYMNLAGLYHSTDTMMQVPSLDNLETINFTQENLAIYKKTAEAYAFGTDLYKELISRYPTQERLIRGILYPVDIQTAIDAEDFTILAYPTSLVETYEYSLIDKLQDWIYGFRDRWYESDFIRTHDLFSSTMLGIMYANIVPAVLNIRLAACKTNEVHTYHIRQYLASHSKLDQYFAYLTREQALFLYRNINYIEHNIGKQSTFDLLVENILTKRNIPIAKYRMKHDSTNQLTDLKPTVMFDKIPINTENNYDLIDEFSIDAVYTKEDPLAIENETYHDDELTKGQFKMVNSIDGDLNTKLLESSMIDYTDSEHYNLSDVLLNHWLYLASEGNYTAYITFEIPSTGISLTLNVKDAFTLYVYFNALLWGITPVEMPLVRANRVIRTPAPAVSDVLKLTTDVTQTYVQDIATVMVQPDANIVSTETFNDYCVVLQKAAMYQYYMAVSEEDIIRSTEKRICAAQYWCDKYIYLGDSEGQTFTQWFSDRDISLPTLTTAQLESLVTTIYDDCTGTVTTKTVTTRDIQKAMIGIMQQLSSYSVQYSRIINEGTLVDAPCPVVRSSSYSGHGEEIETLNLGIDAEINDVTGAVEYEFDFDSGWTSDIVVQQLQEADVDTSVGVIENKEISIGFDEEVIINIDTTVQLPTTWPSNPRGVTEVFGIQYYLALTEDQQTNYPDAWTV